MEEKTEETRKEDQSIPDLSGPDILSLEAFEPAEENNPGPDSESGTDLPPVLEAESSSNNEEEVPTEMETEKPTEDTEVVPEEVVDGEKDSKSDAPDLTPKLSQEVSRSVVKSLGVARKSISSSLPPIIRPREEEQPEKEVDQKDNKNEEEAVKKNESEAVVAEEDDEIEFLEANEEEASVPPLRIKLNNGGGAGIVPAPEIVAEPVDPMLLHLKQRSTPATFSPPPPELNIPIPAGGYPCEECGSAYAMKSLLEFHLERKIMRIQAHCTLCFTNYTFYNRCRYLQHMRKHSRESPSDGPPLFKDVKVNAFTTEELDNAFEEWWSGPALQRISNLCNLYEYEFGTTPLVAKWLEEEQIAEPPILQKISKASEVSTNCSECQEEFENAEDLKRHFVYNLPPNQKQYICRICHAVYFSPCGNSAHDRIHRPKEQQRGPFTCAECGFILKSSKELTSHLAEHRTAPTILNAWRCPKCFTFYSNWNTLIVHIASAHSLHFYKCSLCSQALQGSDAFNSHLRTRHPTGATSDGVPSVLKCPQCDCMHKTKEELVEHVKTHYANLAPFKVFRCPMCGRLLENKQGLISHMGRSHGSHMKPSEILEFPFEIPDVPESNKRASNEPDPPSKKRNTGIDPQRDYASVPAPIVRPIASGRTGSMARSPGTGPGTLLPSLPPGLNVEGGIKCPYCPAEKEETLPNEFMMRLHLKVKHPDKAAELTDPSAPSPPKRRGTGESFGCPICASVFISDNSIKRHFLAAHKISDFEGYFNVHRYEIVKSSGVFGCSVCNAGFQSKPELDVHVKGHGLHFLQKSLQLN